MQNTMIAGMAPPVMQPGMQPVMQPGMGPGGYPQAPPNAGGGAPKTVMIAPSERIVSVAATSGAVSRPAAGGNTGASTTFWIISLLMGVAIGAIAYVIVLQ